MTTDADFFARHITEAIGSIELGGYTPVHSGKVRDAFRRDGTRFIVTSDRQSAFDRILTTIPFKGQILNRISAFWFAQTQPTIPNHLVAVPDPAVSVVRGARVFPVEMIVRGYMTGSTDTSVWMNYKNGVREYCGVHLPEGMHKNEPFAAPIITPTTKPTTGHDELISPEEILYRELMTAEEWEVVSAAALEIFLAGQAHAAQQGLILVDTKFEFGRDMESGEIILVDEVLTPDSSRYWMASSYDERLRAGEEPQSFDKEFLRLWYQQRCDPYHDAELPPAPDELRAKLASIYAEAYELITGEAFVPELGGVARIQKNLDTYFAAQ